MKIFIALFLLATCAFADNNYGEKIYSGNVTIDSYFYNMESGKIIVNQGAKITYNSSADNRGYYENNGEIVSGNNNTLIFSNVLGATFINNGKMTMGQFNNSGSTATFYGDASSYSYAGMSGNFRNIKGGTFYVIGATLSGDFVQENGYGVSGTIQTLIFGMHNSKMGQINGNLTNRSGVVNVNIADMVYNQKYKIITGTIYGLDSVSFVGANLDSVNTYYSNGEVWIERKENPSPDPDNPNPPPQEPSAPHIKSNAQIIKNAIESTFANKVPAFDKTQGAVDLDNALGKIFVAQPTTMLKAFKNSTATMSLNTAHKSHFATKNSAKSSAKITTSKANRLDSSNQMQVFAAPFATLLQGNDLKGNLFGFVGGFAFLADSYVLQTHFAYARGASNQRLSTQSTRLEGDLIEIGGFARLFFFDRFEVDFDADFLLGKFSAENAWLSDSAMNLNANFNNYQLNFGAIIGWRFGERFTIKPFAGAQTHFETQNGFRQNNGLQIERNSYNTLIWGALVGLESRYDFTNGIFIYAKAQYETFSKPKSARFTLKGESLQYANKNYQHIINTNLGASFAVIQSLKIDIEALYQRYNDGINYFGGNVALRWSF